MNHDRSEREPTIYDLAEATSVSVATVSRALNHPESVRSDLRRRILAEAEARGYRRRTIRRPGARAILNIVIVVPDRRQPRFYYDLTELIGAVHSGFAPTRVNTIVSLNTVDSAVFAAKKLGPVDGVLFAFTLPDDALVEQLRERDTPFVLLNRTLNDASWVCNDANAGMRRLVAHTLGAGRRRAVYCSYHASEPIASLRGDALDRALREANLPTAARFSVGYPQDLSPSIVRRISDDGPAVVFACNDTMALRVLNGAILESVGVPGQIGVCGYDDQIVGELAPLRLTTIRLDPAGLARRASEILFDAVVERRFDIRTELIDGDIVVGETTVVEPNGAAGSARQISQGGEASSMSGRAEGEGSEQR